MALNIYQKVAVSFMAVVVALWGYLFLTNTTEGNLNYLFSFLFGLTPLIGGAIAMVQSRVWGGVKSAVGRAVFFIGLGVFCWGVGEAIWSYYNFVLAVPAPYPSLADIGFAPSIFFYGLGAIYLSRATGARYGLRNPLAKIFVFIAPFAVLALSYYLQVVVARGGVFIPEGDTDLKFLLDIVYPLGDFVGLTIAVIVSGLSFKYLGGRYLPDIIAILLGLAVMYVGDVIFAYTTSVGTYYNGSFGDLILATGTFLLTYGALGFSQLKRERAVKERV
jgi:diguanylate cyclase